MKFVLVKNDDRPTWIYRASTLSAPWWTGELARAAKFLSIRGAIIEAEQLSKTHEKLARARKWTFAVHVLVRDTEFRNAPGDITLGPEVWPDPEPVTAIGALACGD
jgi:hypothetical protein